MTRIGTLHEQHLHAALKAWYRRPGDRTEVPLAGFVIDLVRGPQLIEIQTGGFSALRRKLEGLLDQHPLRLVYPVAAEKWIRKVDARGAALSRRRSPRRGQAVDVCAELVAFPALLAHPHLTLEVLLVQLEELQRPQPGAWRRKGWRVAERRLLGVLERVSFATPADLLALLPPDLPQPFTTADLAAGLGRPRALAQSLAYCLRQAGVLQATGRTRAGIEYRRA